LKERKERAKKEIEEHVVNQFGYKPKINKKSERIIMEKSAIMMMHSPQKSVDQQMNNIGNVT
jgi:hypothetical protein